MIYLALGSNLGNRFENLRKAIQSLSEFFECKVCSHVIETEALLLEGSPESWNIPYLNMVIGGESSVEPFEMLSLIKKIEEKVGRNMQVPVWSPRILDIDIVSYHDQIINSEKLKIPHVGVKNRDFLQFLLTEIGYKIPDEIKLNIENYAPLNHYTLEQKLIGIVNVTPDSFSDGGNFLDPEKAENKIREQYSQGAYMIELGAQSTRPGYTEVSASEEISRLEKVFERCNDINCLGLDSYFDEVILYALKNKNIRWINDQNAKISSDTIKKIADADIKLVTMLKGNNFDWFDERIKFLKNCGMAQKNIVIDPGIGFGKTKQENIFALKNTDRLKKFGCEIMIGHSRKSFMTKFSSASPEDRDIETMAVSNFLADKKTDYLRVHNIRDHMKMFTAKHIMEIQTRNCI